MTRREEYLGINTIKQSHNSSFIQQLDISITLNLQVWDLYMIFAHIQFRITQSDTPKIISANYSIRKV